MVEDMEVYLSELPVVAVLHNIQRGGSVDQGLPILLVKSCDIKPLLRMVSRVAQGARIAQLLPHPVQVILQHVAPSLVLLEQSPWHCCFAVEQREQVPQASPPEECLG